jgi:hypothetical protein
MRPTAKALAAASAAHLASKPAQPAQPAPGRTGRGGLPLPSSAASTRATRRPRSPPPARTVPDQPRSLTARGDRGEVRFLIERVEGGLYVEREEIPRRGMRTVQSVAFTDARSFVRWCDDDPVRFEHPLLHVGLKRAGIDCWPVDEPAAGR